MSSELQFRVLRLLEVNPHLTQRELSKSLGVSFRWSELLPECFGGKRFGQNTKLKEQQK